jgi:hypothetical protein
MHKSYSYNAIAKVKLTKGSFYTIKVSWTVAFSIIYKTMWLAVMYYSPLLTGIPCLKDKGELKLKAIISEYIWSLFTSLVSKLSYILLKIIKL